MQKVVTVIGASGQSGLPLVKKLLASGYKVKALVRDAAKLGDMASKVEVIQGSAYRYEDVERAVQGSYYVVSVLGHVKGCPDDLQTVAMRHTIGAMKKFGLTRLISLTGAGVRTEGDQPQFMDKFIAFMLSVISPKILQDAKNHVKVIQESSLDYTILRGPMLTNDPARDNYKLGYVGQKDMDIKISRSDIASCIVDILDDPSQFKTIPFLAWSK